MFITFDDLLDFDRIDKDVDPPDEDFAERCRLEYSELVEMGMLTRGDVARDVAECRTAADRFATYGMEIAAARCTLRARAGDEMLAAAADS